MRNPVDTLPYNSPDSVIVDQDYDMYRAGVRLLQENLFANALDPSQGVEHRDWWRKLSDDFRDPTLKTPYIEAVSRRLRRVYLALLLVLLAAWVFRLTAFGNDATWITNATVGIVPGRIVVGLVGIFYLCGLWIAFRPRPRRSKEEFDREDVQEGEWKDSK